MRIGTVLVQADTDQLGDNFVLEKHDGFHQQTLLIQNYKLKLKDKLDRLDCPLKILNLDLNNVVLSLVHHMVLAIGYTHLHMIDDP